MKDWKIIGIKGINISKKFTALTLMYLDEQVILSNQGRAIEDLT
jgi:hypothetical protein